VPVEPQRKRIGNRARPGSGRSAQPELRVQCDGGPAPAADITFPCGIAIDVVKG